MSIAPHKDSGSEGRQPDMGRVWPVAGALVTLVVTWHLTHDLGIALAAADTFLSAFPPREEPTHRDPPSEEPTHEE